MLRYIYPALLVACVLFILWKGRSEQRIILGALLVGSVNTYFIHISRRGTWLDLDLMMIANEVLVTAIILAVAYRSRKFWPLPIASFQILALMSQLVSIFGQDLQAYAVGVTQGLWAYLQLTLLAIITFRDTQTKTTGTDRSNSIF
jgi:hypothetical protein